MKKIVFLALFILGLVSAVCADVNTYSAYSASGGTNATINIPCVPGLRTYIYGIDALSDISTAVITIKKGAVAGPTVNYTTIGTIGCTSGLYNKHQNFPLIILPVNTNAQFLLNSTTANSLFLAVERK